MLQHSFRLTATDIDRAFEAGHFFAVFQPKTDVLTGKMVGVETFVRWRHPTFGLMPPGLFLGFVEAQGRMRELTELVLTLAIRAARDLRAAGKNWDVSINLGASDLADPRLPQILKTLCGLQNVPANSVIVEVPEYALPDKGSPAEANLFTIKALGCRIALDTGPTPAAAPRPVPNGLFSEIKIGGSAIIRFAHSIRQTGATSQLTQKLRAMRDIGLSAVAVGVEDEETYLALRELGFTAAQGSYIQRALPLQQLLAWDGNWSRGAPAPAAAAEIEMLAAPEEITGHQTMRERAKPKDGPQSAAELLAAVEASARTVIDLTPQREPLDLDEDDESDVYEDAEISAADALPDEEPDGEPELGSANAAPPLTASMIDRPVAPKRPLDQVNLDVPPDFVPRRVPGLEKPVPLRVKEEKKPQSLLGGLFGNTKKR